MALNDEGSNKVFGPSWSPGVLEAVSPWAVLSRPGAVLVRCVVSEIFMTLSFLVIAHINRALLPTQIETNRNPDRGDACQTSYRLLFLVIPHINRRSVFGCLLLRRGLGLGLCFKIFL